MKLPLFNSRFAATLLTLFLSLPAMGGDEKVVVLASIHPLAMIVDAVAGDMVEVQTLLPANISPHTYRMNFSDRQKIADADLVLWVGPEMEAVLRKSLLARDQSAVIQSGEIDGIHWPGTDIKPADEHGHGHERDPHLWLNPDNALLIAQQVERWLVKRFPDKEKPLADNLRRFNAEVEKFIQHSRQQTHEIQGIGFIVLHDAYQQLVEFYQLKQRGVIRLSSGAEKGLKHRAELLRDKGQIRCVFSEPQFPDSQVNQLAQSLNAQVAELDPMGRQFAVRIESGEYSYLLFMQAIIDSLTGCLKD
ncbi:MAG: zinc ABC transporter substrate-binding protein [Porticoccaceae bacterium]|nr:zinc ABC transporter substrate-binding protein [Pseudomonadales bacterium]MCP5172985.1 zinc ABC transporter substrate-binding protein [Pseudomonadales bacterium]MCP5302458.1 zinc ABC transporter substrate-binding protein [Pseudomonadales bacterium]